MMDLRNQQLIAVADIAEQDVFFGDLTWYGYDPSAPEMWNVILQQLLIHCACQTAVG